MRWAPGWLAAAAIGLPQTMAAQPPEGSRPGRLIAGVSVGASAFAGAAQGPGASGEDLAFVPYRPTMWGIQLAFGRDRHRLELSARFGEPGLGLRGVPLDDSFEPGRGVLIVVENSFRLAAFSAGASTRVQRLPGGPAVRLSAALTMERWSAPDIPARTIVGGQTGLAFEVGLTRSLAARAEGEIGFTPESPFRVEDLPEGFRRKSTWRRTLAVAVMWRP